MRKFALLALLFLAASSHATEAPLYAVYYTDQLASPAFDAYSLLVFDKTSHPDLAPLKTRGKKILAYLSLGEVAEYRPYMALLRTKGLLLSKVSKDAYAIDVRNPDWAAYVVEVLMPDILAQGFDGVMLDTADTVLALEEKDKKYAGMKTGIVQLISFLRMHYPEITIMLNRGFAVLPDVASTIDIALAESIYSTRGAKDSWVLQPPAHYASVADMLKNLARAHSNLSVYTLDYWPTDDKEGTRAIYRAQRAQGFTPYVATPDLQQLVPEP